MIWRAVGEYGPWLQPVEYNWIGVLHVLTENEWKCSRVCRARSDCRYVQIDLLVHSLQDKCTVANGLIKVYSYPGENSLWLVTFKCFLLFRLCLSDLARPCVNQSVSQSGSLSVCFGFYRCLFRCLYHPLFSRLSVFPAVCLSLGHINKWQFEGRI